MRGKTRFREKEALFYTLYYPENRVWQFASSIASWTIKLFRLVMITNSVSKEF
ncbi:uncharacterized protein BO95DRAFT_446346, partial [Aspergillus brunneoviolaceus CBS 621.78]